MSQTSVPLEQQRTKLELTSSQCSSQSSSSLDTAAVLKRVEDLRKWQEEQQNELFQAHESQMQHFRSEQERISKLISSNQLNEHTNNRMNYNELDDESSDMKLSRLVSNQFIKKKFNLEAFVDDDYEQDYQYSDNEQINEQEQNDQEIEEAENRLSTILEVSCEESPLKSKQSQNNFRRNVLENNLKNKMKPVIEDDDNDDFVDIVDIDSIPIGIKPTNKMTFEQLIEEKLKQADQLDQEQFSQKSIKKKPFLIKKQSIKTAKPPLMKSTPVLAPPPQPPPILQELPPSELSSNMIGPRKFLKRGEGLKRYQPQELPVVQVPKPVEQKCLQRQTASKLRSVSSSSLTANLQQINQNTINQVNKMKKSHSVTNMTNPVKKTITKTAAKTTIKPTQQAVKLKPAVQYNSTAMPVVQAAKPALHDDSELNEFEQLEQLAEEHPSFRSSVSFVETVLTTRKQNDNNNNVTTKATMFAQMIN